MCLMWNPFWADFLAGHHHVTPCTKGLARGPDGWRSNLRGSEGEAACEETVRHGSQDEMKRKGSINASFVGDT
jgi:hypothetical protein